MLTLLQQCEATTLVDDHATGPGMPLHEPAMAAQVLQVLDPRAGEVALDLTAGTGGHSLALAAAVGPGGALVGVDADAAALQVARSRLEQAAPCPCHLFCLPFSRAGDALAQAGVDGADCALADLGIGSHQLGQEARGFAFDSEAPLDMRYDPSHGPSARDVVNGAPEEELARIFRELGEERHSRAIAAAICRRRAERPIDTPADLCGLIKGVAARRTPRGRTWRIHPATRAMMSLRIYVNRELEELDALLELLPGLMKEGGRAAVITYHSLEARRVKQAWRRQAGEGVLELLVRRPLKPTPDEVSRNPRVRSAQLRAVRMLSRRPRRSA